MAAKLGARTREARLDGLGGDSKFCGEAAHIGPGEIFLLNQRAVGRLEPCQCRVERGKNLIGRIAFGDRIVRGGLGLTQ